VIAALTRLLSAPIRRSPRIPLAVLGLATVMTLAAALTVALTSAGSAATPSAARDPGRTRVTVGVVPATDTAPLFIAIKKGYFRRLGLVVTPRIVAQASATLPDLISGRVDIIAGGSYVPFFQAAASGTARIEVLAAAGQCAGNTLDVLAMPKSKITTPADLAGKTIAVNGSGSMQTLTIDAVLADQGINPAGIRYVEIPFADMPAALASGRVDAISAAGPFITAAEQDGADPVLAQCQDSTTDMPLTGYFSTQAWAAKHPGTALAFQRAIEEAQAAADADRALVRQVLPGFAGITPAAAATVSLPYYPAALVPAQIQRVVALMRSAGLVSGSFDPAPLLLRPAG
jgi:NitT/TauT family transport system substrate-binding protein